mmetsp:Transcript_27234/g.68544  ORF Transcript_27234/g.68544 Transcript_27234/m.68544 type:complete len:429 (-) Transcript_27234:339-1625(-)|eukprot:jgi/Tetstr1/427053/TSEL_017258.t1
MYGYGGPPPQAQHHHHPMPGEPPLLGAGLYGGGGQPGGYMPPPQQPAHPMGGGSGGGFFLPATLTDEGDDGGFGGQYNGLPHSNLYVKNIPEDVTEDQLAALFRVYGTVDSCRLVRNLKTGSSRGYGFVRYNTVEQARTAISALNGHTTAAGTRLEVKFADSDAGPKGAKAVPGTTPSDNLYLRNLPTSWGETELVNLFKPLGDIVECRILNAGQSGDPAVRGMGALVRMASVDQATAAIEGLGQQVPPGGTLPLIVRYADTAEDKARRQQRQIRGAAPAAPGRYSPYSPPHAGGPTGMVRPMSGNLPAGFQGFNPTGMPDNMMGGGGMMGGPPDMGGGTPYTSLYVKNLPPEADKLFLYEKFAPHGAIASVRVMTDDATGVCKGVGFVNYVDHAAALEAIRDLHGLQLGDKQLHVSLQTHRTNMHRR